MRLRRFAESHPYYFALAAVAIFVVIGLLGDAATVAFRLQGATQQLYRVAIEEIVRGVIAALALGKMGWWRDTGFKTPGRPRDLMLFWLPVVPALLNLLGGVSVSSPPAIAAFLLVSLLVGFAEESYFRGLMLHAIAAKNGVWQAAIVTSVLFGSLHVFNILAGSNPQYVMQQMAFAVALGFMYAALVLRTGVIWPVILTHAATDFAAFLALGQLIQTQSPGGLSPLSVITWLAFIGYGVIVLVRRRRPVEDR